MFQEPSETAQLAEYGKIGSCGHALAEQAPSGKCRERKPANGKLVRDSRILGVGQPEAYPASQIFFSPPFFLF
jgi:hypothetical protein